MRCFARPSTHADRDKKSMVFIDGENLIFRYQGMLDEGRGPLNGGVHRRDIFVWHPDILKFFHTPDIIRVAIYLSVVGCDETIEKIRNDICSIDIPIVTRSNMQVDTNRLIPFVFKKPKQSQKTRAVDIAMTIDIMRHSLQRNVDEVCIVSGDGDFAPVVKEVMRSGTRVRVLSFSSGLNSEMKLLPDHFDSIDSAFFEEDGSRKGVSNAL